MPDMSLLVYSRYMTIHTSDNQYTAIATGIDSKDMHLLLLLKQTDRAFISLTVSFQK